MRLVAKDGPTVEASAGVGIAVHPLPAIGTAVDTLVIPGGDGVNAASSDRILVDWVRKRSADARRTASVCTGAFLLAASGALDGRRAVTHWGFWEELAARFPDVAALQLPFALGYVSLIGALLVMPTTLVTAPLGVKVAHALSKRALEVAFGAYLFIVGGRFVISLLGGH